MLFRSKLTNDDALPVIHVVTLLATRAQPAIVRILVAGSATRGESEKRPRKILDFDGRAFACRNMLRGVATITG